MQNLITQIVEFSKKINSSEVKGKNFELFVKEFYHENKLVDFTWGTRKKNRAFESCGFSL